MKTLRLLLFFTLGGVVVAIPNNVDPRHVHIAYGQRLDQMVVTWSTLDNVTTPFVEFGASQLWEGKVTGVSSQFVDTGPLRLVQYIHKVTLKGLYPDTLYLYHCGSDEALSEIFTFKTPPEGHDWSPTLAVYGDMGAVNAQSLPRLAKEVADGLYDAILHVGDFGYDLDTDNGLVGDDFMAAIQPLAAYVPYMTCPGNHENRDNFLHYKSRFAMPGDRDMTYSFDLGPIHFVSISTEFYYFLEYGWGHAARQWNWLGNDLRAANLNRDAVPWIVVFGHRPMYCSNNNTDDCRNHESRVRVGLPFLRLFGLEDMFMEQGVDLMIWAHEHSYERMYPVYNRKVYKKADGSDPYFNPRAPVHVTTGSAGCKERHDDFIRHLPSWTAFRSTDYGYSRLRAINKTHLTMEQVSDDQAGKIIDSFTIIRHAHLSYQLPYDDAEEEYQDNY